MIQVDRWKVLSRRGLTGSPVNACRTKPTDNTQEHRNYRNRIPIRRPRDHRVKLTEVQPFAEESLGRRKLRHEEDLSRVYKA